MHSRPLPARPSARRSSVAAAAVMTVGALLLAGCAGAPAAPSSAMSAGGAFPVETTSCGHTSTVAAPPERAITLNQGATEVMLALGLEDRLAGTAYLDDEVAQRWQEAYASVPVLAEQYPQQEQVLAAEPDFVYASYVSAFAPEVAGTPADLEDAGIASYLSPFGCEDRAARAETSFESVWEEIETVGAAFGVPDVAADVREDQEAVLAALEEAAPGDDVTVFWYDSGTRTPLAGAGSGGPHLVIEATGATNVFADVEGSWAEVSWEDVLAADPDVIVLVDAAWDAAEDKRAHLLADPALRDLRAVAEERFVTVPYSESTPGVRLVDGAVRLGEQIEGLGSAR